MSSFEHSRAASSPRRWTINGDFVTLKPNGVARYASQTVRALDQLIGEGHPLAQGLTIDVVAPRHIGLDHMPVRVVPEYRSARLPQVWVQSQLPRNAPGGIVSLCNLAPVVPRRHIVCIHDLHTYVEPHSYGRGFRLAHRAILPLLGRRAAAVTTVSNLSRDHLIAYGIARPEKIVVTYNGADHALQWQPEKSAIGLPKRPFVLGIGRNEGYKNTELMFRIAKDLDAHGVDVCLAGSFDPAPYCPGGSEVPGNVHVLGRISDDDLAAAYSRALAFLFPSRIEGFGLPAAESMMLGCPLVASTAPCLPEVCGDAALYADPGDDGEWVAAILRILREPGLAERLAARGRNQVQRYTWRHIAETYLRLMNEVDSAPDGGQVIERPQRRNVEKIDSECTA